MSKNHIEKIVCPKCNTESDFVLWDSINTMLDPEMKAIVWYYSGMSNYLYEAIPVMVLSTIVLLGVSKATGGPDESITEGFNKYIAMLKSNKEKAKAERKKA